MTEQSRTITLETPIGEVKIPYNEEKVVDVFRKINKVGNQEKTLEDCKMTEFLEVEELEDLEEEWWFWEDTKVPAMIYDLNKWIDIEFDIVAKHSFGNRGAKMTNISYQNFDYPHGKERFATRCTYYLLHKKTNSKYVWKVMPLDGVHIETVIYQSVLDPSSSIETIKKSFEKYMTTEGVLKNNAFDAKYRFLKQPTTTFSDVVLSKEQENLIKKNIVRYIQNLDFYKERGLPVNRGALIVGPPGTGKTLTCEAIINEIKATIIYITADDIHQQGTIDDLYKLANGLSPSVVIVEDIDTLGGLDRRETGNHPLLGEFLNCLNGVERNKGVITIATTNYPEHLDKALTRAGRFDIKINFNLPDEDLRLHILEKYLESHKTSKNINLKSIVKKTKGLSGAFLKEVVMLATIDSFEENGYNSKTVITQKHLDNALENLIKNRDDYSFGKENPMSGIHG